MIWPVPLYLSPLPIEGTYSRFSTQAALKPLCLCTPHSPFLSHLSLTSFSQFLISFQNSHRHHPAHSPPNPTFLYLCPACRLGEGPPLDSQSSVLKAASCPCLHLVITCLPAFMAPDCELDCEARVGLDLSSLSAVLSTTSSTE